MQPWFAPWNIFIFKSRDRCCRFSCRAAVIVAGHTWNFILQLHAAGGFAVSRRLGLTPVTLSVNTPQFPHFHPVKHGSVVLCKWSTLHCPEHTSASISPPAPLTPSKWRLWGERHRVSVCSDLIPVLWFSRAGLNEATGKLLKLWTESSSLDAVVNSWMVQSQCYIRLRKSKTLRLPAAQRLAFPHTSTEFYIKFSCCGNISPQQRYKSTEYKSDDAHSWKQLAMLSGWRAYSTDLWT